MSTSGASRLLSLRVGRVVDADVVAEEWGREVVIEGLEVRRIEAEARRMRLRRSLLW